MTTGRTRLPRRSILRISTRRGPETALLHQAASTRKSRTITKVQLIERATMNE
jgi:hypothetical protein